MRKFAVFLAACLLPAGLQAGTILGVVRAEPKAGTADAAGGGGKYDSRRYKFVEKVDYSELTGFVVYIDKPLTNAVPPTEPVRVITQRDAVFRPHVLPILKGTVVEWPNKDDIFHNVFSVSEANPFDLGLYKDPEVKKVPFPNTGRVDVFCSIHSKMSCIILVLENPWFASTDEKGRYRIENVPAGEYKLKAWHERLPAKTVQIAVPEQGEVKADFVLGITDLPKY